MRTWPGAPRGFQAHKRDAEAPACNWCLSAIFVGLTGARRTIRSGVDPLGLGMPETTTRDQIREAIDRLPPDATFEDAIERLVFLAKIEAGLAELDAGKGVPHDEVKRRLGL